MSPERRWRLLDALLVPWAVGAGMILHRIRKTGFDRLPGCRAALDRVGVLPIRAHYYEPWVGESELRRGLLRERSVPGLELGEAEQLELLRELRWGDELSALPLQRPDVESAEPTFFYRNGFFETGDAELYYSLVRWLRPRAIVEVGGGFSTLIARLAVAASQRESAAYSCRHTCIEPHENSWLEATGAEVLRSRVEDAPWELFAELQPGDILFIDSSHVVRPGGDVLHLVLEVLPRLRRGVWVHFHDVFTPRHYPVEWLLERRWLWTEQYLLEAFLSCNSEYRIRLAAAQLARDRPEQLAAACPMWGRERPAQEPASLWLERL